MPEAEATPEKVGEAKNEQSDASFLTVSLTLLSKATQAGGYKQECQWYTHIHKQGLSAAQKHS